MTDANGTNLNQIEVDLESIQVQIVKLKDNIRNTKGAKFNAQKRLETQSAVSLVSLSLLSILVITSGLIVGLFSGEIGFAWSKVLTLWSSIMAALILFLNAFEYSRNYALRADRMLRCAHELNELYNLISVRQHTGQADSTSLKEFVEQYDRIISRYPDNHHDIDFLKYRWRIAPSKPLRDRNEADDAFTKRIHEFKRDKSRHAQYVLRTIASKYQTAVFFVVVPGGIFITLILFALLDTSQRLAEKRQIEATAMLHNQQAVD